LAVRTADLRSRTALARVAFHSACRGARSRKDALIADAAARTVGRTTECRKRPARANAARQRARFVRRAGLADLAALSARRLIAARDALPVGVAAAVAVVGATGDRALAEATANAIERIAILARRARRALRAARATSRSGGTGKALVAYAAAVTVRDIALGEAARPHRGVARTTGLRAVTTAIAELTACGGADTAQTKRATVFDSTAAVRARVRAAIGIEPRADLPSRAAVEAVRDTVGAAIAVGPAGAEITAGSTRAVGAATSVRTRRSIAGGEAALPFQRFGFEAAPTASRNDEHEEERREAPEHDEAKRCSKQRSTHQEPRYRASVASRPPSR
jgi:hypothetical protein